MGQEADHAGWEIDEPTPPKKSPAEAPRADTAQQLDSFLAKYDREVAPSPAARSPKCESSSPALSRGSMTTTIG
jgi:hypothetical protein